MSISVDQNQPARFLPLNGWGFFLLILIAYFLNNYLRNHFLLTEDFYRHNFGEQLPLEQLESLLNVRTNKIVFGYIMTIPLVFFRAGFTAFCLNVGCLFLDMKVKLKHLFHIALFAEIAMVVHSLLVTVLLIFQPSKHSVTEVSDYSPFSLYGLLGKENIDLYFSYPAQLINIFEIIYWLLLAWAVSRFLRLRFGKSIKLVSLSYGVGILAWAIIVTFISLSFMP